MKKQFKNFEMSIVYLAQADVITTSGGMGVVGESYFDNELPVLPFRN
jgi:hypothetical protein